LLDEPQLELEELDKAFLKLGIKYGIMERILLLEKGRIIYSILMR